MLVGADLSESDLTGAILSLAHCRATNFFKSKLLDANHKGADFTSARLEDADLSGANLIGATLVDTDMTRATLLGAQIYGISAWNLRLAGAKQSDLVITQEGEPKITVDDVKLAQFTYLLLDNEQIRDVIDTIGKKGVLILGRFIEERKAVLDAIRNKLRNLGFVPMMFDFERPTQRDFTETIKTLAGMSRFIVADITNPKSSPLELQATVPDYMIPFVPIIHEGEEAFSMFRDLKNHYGEWVLDVLEYDSVENLVAVLDEAIVRPALEVADRLLLKKTEVIRKRSVGQYR